MTKKVTSKKPSSPSFEETLTDLETIVTRLESGELPLEEALSEFERGIALARAGQKTLQCAEQRVQILLNNDEKSQLNDFSEDSE